jgi:diketogulonate reductase-like aldo/keto reductase
VTLRAAREARRVRYIGVTHYLASAHVELERVIRREKPDFLQVHYSVAEPQAGHGCCPSRESSASRCSSTGHSRKAR